jgi:hypothetical protein
MGSQTQEKKNGPSKLDTCKVLFSQTLFMILI